MIGRSITLIAGVAAGFLLMQWWDGKAPEPAPGSDEPAIPARAEHREERRDERSAGSDQPAIETGEILKATESDPQASPPDAGYTPSRIPDLYRRLLEDRPRGPTTREMHAMFQREPRDEAWASDMESGIGTWLSTYAAPRGMVVEYVECRSRFCEVAGYAIQGYEPDFSSVWTDMQSQDWWQASGGMSAQYDGDEVTNRQRRFVAILPRYDDQEMTTR